MSFCAENNNALRVVSPSQPLLVPCHTSTTVLFWYIAVTVCSKICKWVQCFQFCVYDVSNLGHFIVFLGFFRDLPTLWLSVYRTHLIHSKKKNLFFGALCNSSISKNIFFPNTMNCTFVMFWWVAYVKHEEKGGGGCKKIKVLETFRR